MDWFNRVGVAELYVSCITFGELYKGIELLKDNIKRNKLKKHTAEIVTAFNNQMLIINLDTMLIWSKLMSISIKLMSISIKKGKTALSIDALIVSQSIQNNFVLVTRNTNDFEQFDQLEVYCPWSK